jgi:hypothetical protein
LSLIDPGVWRPAIIELSLDRDYVINNGKDNAILTATVRNANGMQLGTGIEVTFKMTEYSYFVNSGVDKSPELSLKGYYSYPITDEASFSPVDHTSLSRELVVLTGGGIAMCRGGYTKLDSKAKVHFFVSVKDDHGKYIYANGSLSLCKPAIIDLSGPSSLVADGSSYNLYTIYVEDNKGHPANNVDVTISNGLPLSKKSLSYGQMAGEGSYAPEGTSVIVTTQDGYARFKYGWATASDDYVTLTATVDGYQWVSCSKQVRLMAPEIQVTTTLPLNNSSVRPAAIRSVKLTGPGQVAANGNDTILLTAYVEDSTGKPANNVKVDFLCRNNSPEYGSLSLIPGQQLAEASNYTQDGFATVWFGRATVQESYNEVAAVVADNHSIYDTRVIDLLPVGIRSDGLDTNATTTPGVLPGKNDTLNGTTQNATGQNGTSPSGTSQNGTAQDATIMSSDTWNAYFNTSQASGANSSGTGDIAGEQTFGGGSGDRNVTFYLAGGIFAVILVLVFVGIYFTRRK